MGEPMVSSIESSVLSSMGDAMSSLVDVIASSMVDAIAVHGHHRRFN